MIAVVRIIKGNEYEFAIREAGRQRGEQFLQVGLAGHGRTLRLACELLADCGLSGCGAILFRRLHLDFHHQLR